MSIKSALNVVRVNRYHKLNEMEIIKQFDSLPTVDKQNLYNKYKGRKMNLGSISNLDKISIIQINKICKI